MENKWKTDGCWQFYSDKAVQFCWSLIDKESKILFVTSAYEMKFEHALIALRKYVGKLPGYTICVNRIDMTTVFRRLERTLQTYKNDHKTIEVFPWGKNTFIVISSTQSKFPLYPFIGDTVTKKELKEKGYEKCIK